MWIKKHRQKCKVASKDCFADNCQFGQTEFCQSRSFYKHILNCFLRLELWVRGHPLSMHTKFSEKLTFLTPWYAHLRGRIRELEILVFQKILRTYLMAVPVAYYSENWEVPDLNHACRWDPVSLRYSQWQSGKILKSALINIGPHTKQLKGHEMQYHIFVLN